MSNLFLSQQLYGKDEKKNCDIIVVLIAFIEVVVQNVVDTKNREIVSVSMLNYKNFFS